MSRGVPPSGSGRSPRGGAAKASPAKPSVPNADERDDPKRHLPLSREEKFAAFIIYIRALEAAGLSPGFGRINHDDGKGVDFAFGLPNFMLRNALLTAPDTVAEAAEILAQNDASAIEARRAETAQTGSVADESAVGNAETPGTSIAAPENNDG